MLQHLSRASRKVYDAVISKSISALLVSNNEDVVDTIVQLIKCDAVAEITLVSKKNQLIHPLKQHANQLLDLFLTNHNFEGLRHLLIQPPNTSPKRRLPEASRNLGWEGFEKIL